MRGLLIFAGIVALLYGVAVLSLQRRVLYPRVPAPSRVPSVAGLEHWQLGPASDVDAFYLKPTRAAAEPHGAVIFAHGNGELIDMWIPDFEPARAAGLAVLLVEFPGYGRSGGSASEAAIARIFEDAYDRLAARPDIDATRIAGYGRSLGGGAIGNLSRARSLAAIVFESTFSSTLPLAASMFVPAPLVLDRYDNLAAISAFAGPVLILHGERDTLIPPAHAEALHAASPGSRLHLLPCGHNDCPRRWDLLTAFFSEAGLTQEKDQ